MSGRLSNMSGTGSTDYNYDEVLYKSILFYEAQRSGALPADNRVPWRGDSALGDKGENGEDLTGGWYDAGDCVKFNFPMAQSTSTLIWGLLEYKDAYVAAGEYDNMLDSIKWPLDYFIKCHVEDNVVYGQVGNGGLDHAYWGRPEDMTMDRPAYKLDTSNPGSDLAAEMAAAMAAGSLAFKDKDASYSANLLEHAVKLYDFAYRYRGKYTDSITDAFSYYNSWSGYEDELGWAALWLYWATENEDYLTKAEEFFQYYGGTLSFSWDSKKGGYWVLYLKLAPKGSKAIQSETELKKYLENWINEIPRTPGGLAWASQWGSNRYAANAAWIALAAAEQGVMVSKGREFAREQIHAILGDSGRSFVVGYGQNPPERPHHSAASCPNPPEVCDWNDYSSPDPNPHILYGALVGGPDQDGVYTDDRSDYISNEVACDYNAGFQSVIAGLIQLSLI